MATATTATRGDAAASCVEMCCVASLALALRMGAATSATSASASAAAPDGFVRVHTTPIKSVDDDATATATRRALEDVDTLATVRPYATRDDVKATIRRAHAINIQVEHGGNADTTADDDGVDENDEFSSRAALASATYASWLDATAERFSHAQAASRVTASALNALVDEFASTTSALTREHDAFDACSRALDDARAVLTDVYDSARALDALIHAAGDVDDAGDDDARRRTPS